MGRKIALLFRGFGRIVNCIETLREEKKMEEKPYLIISRESGDVIEHSDTVSEAENIIREYETEDKDNGIFSDDFYEIIINPKFVRKI